MISEEKITDFAFVLQDLIDIGLNASQDEISFGPPCSYLTREAGRSGVLALARQMLSSHQYEFRLNGAGLKLLVSTDGQEVKALVGGDQYNRYPTTGPDLNKLLKDLGYQ